MARAGAGSRREVERMIRAGKVSLDGKVLKDPALKVVGTAGLTIDGKPVSEAQPTRLWRYYKPRGVVTTHQDPEGRPTVFSKLPVELGRVISVGRLDFNTEGLMLLTNDGELARWMELPSTGWKRSYRARVYGRMDEGKLAELAKGIELEGIRYLPIEAKVESKSGKNVWLRIELREGKNREIRKVLKHLGLEVSRLIRTSFGPFEIGQAKHGDVRAIHLSSIPDMPAELKQKLQIKAGGHKRGKGWAKSKRKSRPRRK